MSGDAPHASPSTRHHGRWWGHVAPSRVGDWAEKEEVSKEKIKRKRTRSIPG